MKFKKTTESLPLEEKLDGTMATYYLINIDGYGIHKAMFLVNDKGEKDWYSNYFSKIIHPVTHWSHCPIL
jgi:hypothetical protein